MIDLHVLLAVFVIFLDFVLTAHAKFPTERRKQQEISEISQQLI